MKIIAFEEQYSVPAIAEANPNSPRKIFEALRNERFSVAALGVIQAPEDEPGSLPGICNAAFGIGGSLGFTWAGAIIGEGAKASYHSALWMAVAIGVAAFAASLILKPRSAPVVSVASGLSH